MVTSGTGDTNTKQDVNMSLFAGVNKLYVIFNYDIRSYNVAFYCVLFYLFLHDIYSMLLQSITQLGMNLHKYRG